MASTVEVPDFGSVDLASESAPALHDVLVAMTMHRSGVPLYRKIALIYYHMGRHSDFVKVLRHVQNELSDRATPSEKVMVNNSLGAHFVNLAIKASSAERETLLEEAIIEYNRNDSATQRDTSDDMLLTSVGRGIIRLLQGNIDIAIQQFDLVLNSNKAHIPAKLGRACASYMQKDYTEALRQYRSVIRTNPNCPAVVRFGIGLCLFQLGDEERARLAFERTLQLDPENVDALAALAVVELNRRRGENSQQAMQLLRRAHQLDKHNINVLVYLAEHFFFAGKHDLAHRVSVDALERGAGSDEARALASYQLARLCHARGNFDDAFHKYQFAVQHDPLLMRAHYGLGQMYIGKGDNAKAVECFERVVAADPDSYEAMKILGSLHGSTSLANRPGARDKAIGYLQRVTEKYPDDFEVWIELGQLYEGTSKVDKALEAYEAAAAVLEEQVGIRVYPEISNNIGVLRQRLGNFAGARVAFEQTQATLVSSAGDVTGEALLALQAMELTLRYNMALLCDHEGDKHRAEVLFRDLLADHPTYTDARLRLARLAMNRDDLVLAQSLCEEAIQLIAPETSADAEVLLATVMLARGDIQGSLKRYEQVTQAKGSKKDPYAMLSMGNLYLQLAKRSVHDKVKEERNFRLALQCFTDVLSADTKNIFAANGAAAVLAEQGEIAEARSIFLKVREATGDSPSVWNNLALTYVAQGQYVNAVKMYEKCLRKFYFNHDLELMHQHARALFKAEEFSACKKVLLKAMHAYPASLVARYNLGVALEYSGMSVLLKDNQSLEQVQGAVADLRYALKTFKDLQEMRGNHAKHKDWRYLPEAMVNGEASKTDTFLSQGETHLQRAEQVERERRERILAQEMEMQAYREQKAALEREKEAKRLERERELDEKARLFQEENRKRLEAQVQASREQAERDEERRKKQVQRGASGGRGRVMGESLDDDEIADDIDLHEEELGLREMEGFVAGDDEVVEDGDSDDDEEEDNVPLDRSARRAAAAQSSLSIKEREDKERMEAAKELRKKRKRQREEQARDEDDDDERSQRVSKKSHVKSKATVDSDDDE